LNKNFLCDNFPTAKNLGWANLPAPAPAPPPHQRRWVDWRVTCSTRYTA